jgi:hypothetical protein
VGYDPLTSILEIEFHEGSAYQYFAVPGEVFGELLAAASKGRYFHSHIKNQYRHSKVG